MWTLPGPLFVGVLAIALVLGVVLGVAGFVHLLSLPYPLGVVLGVATVLIGAGSLTLVRVPSTRPSLTGRISQMREGRLGVAFRDTLSRMTRADFGPNGAALVSFLNSASLLTVDQWDAVASTWRSEGKPVLVAWLSWYKRRSPRKATEDEDRRRANDRAFEVASNIMRTIERQASFALLDACVAIVNHDRLTPKQFSTLYEPFEPVIPYRSIDRLAQQTD